VGLENNLININKMNVEDFYNESEYSKIDFGSNPTLFTKKELLDFSNEYLEAITVTRCCTVENEQLRFLIDKFQTPKGNYLIELLMAEKERKDKKP